jgi:hypothetical protein
MVTPCDMPLPFHGFLPWLAVFFHAVPVMVQRWNRGRIERLFHRVALSHTKTQNAYKVRSRHCLQACLVLSWV